MPWSTSNPPSAASKYSDKCKRAFVHAANSTLEKTGDDGRAIAAGHAAAKQCEGKKAMDGLTTFNFELGTAARPLLASLDTDTGVRRIEGISSSTLRDGHGDEVTFKALQKMAKQAIGMTVWLNHEYRVPPDVFGTITRAKVLDSGERDEKGAPIYDLMCGMEVEDENEAAIKTHRMIEKGRKLGISVGAMIPDEGVTKSADGGRYVFDDVELVEMSIVGVPANSRCWATVATKALKDNGFVVKEQPGGPSGEELEERREGEQTSEVDVREGTDPDGASDGIVTGPDLMESAEPDPDAEPAGEVDEAEEGQKDQDSVSEGGQPDGIVTTDDIGLEGAEDQKKSRITVWDGDKTVQIDTGRTRKTGDDQSAQDDEPESAGGLPSGSTKALSVGASSDALLVKALRGNLDMAMKRISVLEAERDAALEHAAAVVEKTASFIDELGKTPMGRRAVFEETTESFKRDFTTDPELPSFLDPQVKRLLIRRSRPPAEVGSPGT